MAQPVYIYRVIIIPYSFIYWESQKYIATALSSSRSFKVQNFLERLAIEIKAFWLKTENVPRILTRL